MDMPLDYCDTVVTKKLNKFINSINNENRMESLIKKVSIIPFKTSSNTVHYRIFPIEQQYENFRLISNYKGKIIYVVVNSSIIIPPKLKFDRKKFNEIIFNLGYLNKD